MVRHVAALFYDLVLVRLLAAVAAFPRLALLPVILAGPSALAQPLPSQPSPTPTAPSKISIYVGTSAGGGYDLYARLVARHVGRLLPGNPTVVVNNMPGAGAVIMANYIANAAPKDGSAIGLIPTTAAFAGLLGNKSANYDGTKFNWLGSVNRYATVAFVWHQTPYMTAQDLLSKPIVVGGAAPASDVTIWPKLVNSLLGAKLKVVTGYVGTSQISVAMERGEVEGLIGWDWDGVKASKPDWIRDSKIRILMQFSPVRLPELPDVPTPLELLPDQASKDLMALFVDRQIYGRPFAMPSGTPPETVSRARAAFAAMCRDDLFLADALKIGAAIDCASGEQVEALARRFYATPVEVLERARREFEKAGN